LTALQPCARICPFVPASLTHYFKFIQQQRIWKTFSHSGVVAMALVPALRAGQRVKQAGGASPSRDDSTPRVKSKPALMIKIRMMRQWYAIAIGFRRRNNIGE